MSKLPDEPIDRLKVLEAELISCATGGPQESVIYETLRREFCNDVHFKKIMPSFVRAHRTLHSFWGFIQPKFDTYKERRTFIYSSFTPVFDHLENKSLAIVDPSSANLFETFDPDGIYRTWIKAVDRRKKDPEGAITSARTLLETVLLKVLEERNEHINTKDDLPKLYAKVSKKLNLAPSEHSHEAVKTILGGATAVVGGLGSLRNKMSDAHAEGVRLPVRPSERHAKLAVDMAAVVATFIIDTHLAQLGNKPSPPPTNSPPHS